MSTHEELAKKTLGRLVRQAYSQRGQTRGVAAKAMGVASKTLYSVEMGHTAPQMATRHTIEDYLGWRRGSISELLESGPTVDLGAVTLRAMSAVPSSEWLAAEPPEMDETARRIQEDALALSTRLRERDRTVEWLEAELKQQRERIDELQGELHEALEALRAEQKRSEALANGFDLAADDSANKGAELRAVLDEVAEGNQNVGGRG